MSAISGLYSLNRELTTYGLSALKASPITWSSNMWSTFHGFGPDICLGSSGLGIGVVVVSTKLVKEAAASLGPTSIWYHVAVG